MTEKVSVHICKARDKDSCLYPLHIEHPEGGCDSLAESLANACWDCRGFATVMRDGILWCDEHDPGEDWKTDD